MPSIKFATTQDCRDAITDQDNSYFALSRIAPFFIMTVALTYGFRLIARLLMATLIVLSTGSVSVGMEDMNPILPLSVETFEYPGLASLGERLFNDTRLSGDGTISCASCHNLASAGDDGKPVSVGINGALGPINAPTVYNAGLNIAQFWDGRADTLEEQAAGPVTNPIEMGAKWPDVIARIKADPSYSEMFAAAFPDGVTPANVTKAIARFERTLVTTDSPFDGFLGGDDRAITQEQKKGFALFKSYGCAACHQGKNVGGNMYQRMGSMGDYFSSRSVFSKADLGRFNVTKDPDDRHVFKVPSLRLAPLTAPYFHDGSTKSLKEAIVLMGRFQLGVDIPERDVVLIEAFIESLVGHHPLLER